MPIVETAPANSPLGPGDIVVLPNGGVCLDAEGNVLRSDDAKHGLVISRDCAGTNGAAVLVAQIHATKPGLPKVKRAVDDASGAKGSGLAKTLEEQFEDALGVLEAARDGGASPDAIYLGTLPGAGAARWAARLDRVLHIELPQAIAPRSAWVRKYRTFRLTEDFRRSLPTRLYWALCRAGYDDHDWFADEDLKFLIGIGDAWVSQLERDLSLARVERDRFEADADEAARQKGMRQQVEGVAALERQLQGVKDRLAPYRTRLDSRAK